MSVHISFRQKNDYFTKPGDLYLSPATKKYEVIPEYKIYSKSNIEITYSNCKIIKDTKGNWWFVNYNGVTDKEKNEENFKYGFIIFGISKNKYKSNLIKCNSKLHAMFFVYDKISKSDETKSFSDWLNSFSANFSK